MTAVASAAAGKASPAPRPLRTELRRGVGPWAGLAVLVAVAVAMYAKAPGWQGRWADATNLLHVASGLLVCPLALAAGCWHGGRDRRRGALELLASVPRDPLRRTLVAVAPAALWPAAGYLAGAAGCLLAVWPYASAGRPFVELIVADAVAVAALGVLGALVGRAVPWRLTAPLLAVVGYVGLGLASYTERPVRWLSPAGEHHYVWDRPVWWFAPASVAWTAGLALAVLVAYAARPGRRKSFALLPLTLALAAAVPLLRLGEAGPWRPDPAAARQVCDDGTPQVCVTAVDARFLPDLTAALAGLNDRLRGVPGTPVRWVNGPNGAERPGDVALPMGLDDSSRGRLAQSALWAHAAASELMSDTCEPAEFGLPGQDEASVVHLAVAEWLAPNPEGYGPDVTAAQPYVDRLDAKSPAEQRAYLARYLAADGCVPSEVPRP